jgi:hypothetical protein
MQRELHAAPPSRPRAFYEREIELLRAPFPKLRMKMRQCRALLGYNEHA